MVFPFNTTSTKNKTIYETNDCHLFTANAYARSARAKQVESSSPQAPWIEAPRIEAPDKSPGYKPSG